MNKITSHRSIIGATLRRAARMTSEVSDFTWLSISLARGVSPNSRGFRLVSARVPHDVAPKAACSTFLPPRASRSPLRRISLSIPPLRACCFATRCSVLRRFKQNPPPECRSDPISRAPQVETELRACSMPVSASTAPARHDASWSGKASTWRDARVARLMKSMGLRGAFRVRPIRTTRSDKATPCPRDKVTRRFPAPASNRLWVSDVTCVATWQGFVSFGPCPGTDGGQALSFCHRRLCQADRRLAHEPHDPYELRPRSFGAGGPTAPG